jgi:hypothetical protein
LYKERLIELIQEIQSHFSPELLKLTFLKPIKSKELDELLERILVVYPPVFLPIFVNLNDDLIAVHLKPKASWKEGVWVELEHDSAEPRFLASCFNYLPYTFFFPPFNIKGYVDEIWDHIQNMLNEVNQEIPDKEYIQKNIEKRFEVLSKYDRYNGVIKLSFFTGELYLEDEAREPVEKLFHELPEDTYILAATAIIRSVLEYDDSMSLAVKVLQREIPHGFYYLYWTDNGKSVPELLELIRPIALPGLNPDSPLLMLKDVPYTKAGTANILRQIAAKFRELGNEEQALNHLRNGAAVAARYGQRLDKQWCQELAEQADRIELGSPAASFDFY